MKVRCHHCHRDGNLANYLLKRFWQVGDLEDQGLPTRQTSFLASLSHSDGDEDCELTISTIQQETI